MGRETNEPAYTTAGHSEMSCGGGLAGTGGRKDLHTEDLRSEMLNKMHMSHQTKGQNLYIYWLDINANIEEVAKGCDIFTKSSSNHSPKTC